MNQTVFHKNQGLDIIEDEFKALPLLEIKLIKSIKSKESLSKMTENERKLFLIQVKEFYETAVKHIVNKMVNKKILKYLQCISP